MKAMIINKCGEQEKVKLANVETPKSADNEVQIEIKFTSVNPVDWKIKQGLLQARIEHEFPLILGWDAAGVITEIGKNVRSYKVGDEIFAYCRKPTIHSGTYAEYICLDAQHIALKPHNITFAEAAAIPLTGLTAWQSLFNTAKLQAGETVLIHAGAGGVGGIAIQFAKQAGAKVITTASKKNHEYVKQLGAEIVIDYEKENFVQFLKSLFPNGIDVVFDTVGKQTLKSSYEVLKQGGRLVTIVEPIDEALNHQFKVQGSYVFVTPNGTELKKIADLMTQGKVKPPAIEEMRLEDAQLALEKSQSGRTKGKIVLKVE